MDSPQNSFTLSAQQALDSAFDTHLKWLESNLASSIQDGTFAYPSDRAHPFGSKTIGGVWIHENAIPILAKNNFQIRILEENNSVEKCVVIYWAKPGVKPSVFPPQENEPCESAAAIKHVVSAEEMAVLTMATPSQSDSSSSNFENDS